jgi:EAL domain-containing protein (putative c-di-GMP-specific phosphodiesterase class I)
MKIASNLSPAQLLQPDYVERVRTILEAAGVEPKRIMFEITETVAMRDVELATEMIHRFQNAEFDVAIDDFGIGYSSMAYLQQFRVKQLKIDHFFTDGLDNNGEEGMAIVSPVIELAHSLQMVVVAEGVEIFAARDAFEKKMLSIICRTGVKDLRRRGSLFHPVGEGADFSAGDHGRDYIPSILSSNLQSLQQAP